MDSNRERITITFGKRAGNLATLVVNTGSVCPDEKLIHSPKPRLNPDCVRWRNTILIGFSCYSAFPAYSFSFTSLAGIAYVLSTALFDGLCLEVGGRGVVQFFKN